MSITKVFFPYYAKFDSHGGLKSLGIITFDARSENISDGIMCDPFSSGHSIGIYNDSDREYPVYFNRLDRFEDVFDDFINTFKTEEIPIDKLSEKLGEENVLTNDNMNNSFIQAPINIHTFRCGDIATGRIFISHMQAISLVREDGSVIKDAYQIVGTKGEYPRKPRSKTKILKFRDKQQVYMIGADGVPVSAKINDIEKQLDAEKKAAKNAALTNTEYVPSFVCGNMQLNGETCLNIPCAKIVSGESKSLKYNDLVSATLICMGDNVESHRDSFTNQLIVDMKKLPENTEYFLAPKDAWLPISVENISCNNKCTTIICPETTVDTVMLCQGSNLFFDSSWKKTINDDMSFSYFSTGYPQNISSNNAVPSCGSAIRYLKLPANAAGGVVAELCSIDKLDMPEICGFVFSLLLKQSRFKSLDLTPYSNAEHYLDVGKNSELTEVSLGGIGRCHFAGYDLANLRKVNIRSDVLDHIDLRLNGLCNDLEIVIDTPVITNRGIMYTPFWYQYGEEYTPPAIEIIINASKPVNITIYNKSSESISILRSNESQKFHYSVA